MSLPAAVVLVLALVSLALLVIMGIALVKQMLLLGRTVQSFAEAVRPAADEIAAQADRARQRAEALQVARPDD
jgi:hypothetical protein